MLVIPAIDILEGEVVRLQKGDFDRTTSYGKTPQDFACDFEDQGASWIHIVDLSGAKSGAPAELNSLEKIKRNSCLQIQYGGGLRSEDDIRAALSAGADRIILGTIAIKNPDAVLKFFESYGADKFTLALDAVPENEDFRVVTNGWLESSEKTLEAALLPYKSAAPFTLLVTDISKDGMLQGPNFDLYRYLIEKFSNFKIQASGGVSSLAHIEKLSKIGAHSVIIGKSLYENKFMLREAINAC